MNPGTDRLLPTLCLLLAGGASCACPPTSPADAAVDLPRSDSLTIFDPDFELGTGQSSWEPLLEGARIELIHGPQGGYHLFARLRERQLGSDVQVTFRVTPEGGGDPINDPADRIRLLEGRGLLRTAQGWESTSALLVILVRVRNPLDVVGRRFVLETIVSPTGSGATASVRRIVTIVDKT